MSHLQTQLSSAQITEAPISGRIDSTPISLSAAGDSARVCFTETDRAPGRGGRRRADKVGSGRGGEGGGESVRACEEERVKRVFSFGTRMRRV